MNKVKKIDLIKYKENNSKFIVGRENGNLAMKKEKLIELVHQVKEGKLEKISIIVSENIYGIVSSFILGFFAEVVYELKNKEQFYRVFDLSELDPEIKKQIDEEIDYILGE